MSAYKSKKWAVKCGSNIDLPELKLFLERLSQIIDSGFSVRDAKRVHSFVEQMDLDDEKAVEFPIVHDGKEATLRIAVFIDDEPDLEFATDHRPLGKQIQAEFRSFMSSHEASLLQDLASSLAYVAPPPLTKGQWQRKARAWHKQWPKTSRRLKDVGEVGRTPDRAIVVCERRDEPELSRLFMFDKARDEYIEWRLRGVNLLNSLSLAGVQWTDVAPSAAEWIRKRLSGRRVVAKGRIE